MLNSSKLILVPGVKLPYGYEQNEHFLEIPCPGVALSGLVGSLRFCPGSVSG